MAPYFTRLNSDLFDEKGKFISEIGSIATKILELALKVYFA